MCLPQKLPPSPHVHQPLPLTSANPTFSSCSRSIPGGGRILSHGNVPTQCVRFLEDIDRYMLELSNRNSPGSSSSFVTALSTQTTSSSNISASSSPIPSEEERVLQRLESWWTGGNAQVPLPSTHPCYHQACHSCHRLGHYCNQCPIYQCPSCLCWELDHNPNQCPLRRCPVPPSPSDSSPTTSYQSSGSSRCSPLPAPPPRCSHSPYPRPYRPRNRNHSPISDQDDADIYKDISGDGVIDSVGWSNITGSPCGSDSGYF